MHYFLRALLVLGSSTMLFSTSAADDTMTFAVGPNHGAGGHITIHRDQAFGYLKDELGIDMEKLLQHPELISPGYSGNYTLPERSGIEGMLSWNVTAQEHLPPSIPNKVTNCEACAITCLAGVWLPIFAIPCLIACGTTVCS
ncbi:hypothetical protein AAE478_006683 [Parahypoxylon ruwenzoriense]